MTLLSRPMLRVCLSAILVVQVTSAMAQTTLKVSTCLPKNDDLSESFLATFVERMKQNEKSVRLNFIGGPEVTAGKEQPAALKRGLIDIILCPTYYAGIVPEARLLLPANESPDELRKNGGWDLMQEAWLKGMNARILAWGYYGVGKFYLYTGFTPTANEKTGIDLSGKKIRSTLNYVPLIKAMGGTPVTMAPSEVYTALERGVVDGFVWPEGSVTKYGWHKYVKVRVSPGFFRLGVLTMMNADKFNSLSAEAQNQLSEAGRYMEKESSVVLRKKIDADTRRLMDAGVKELELKGAQRTAYLKSVYESTWDAVKNYKYKVDFQILKSKLYNPAN